MFSDRFTVRGSKYGSYVRLDHIPMFSDRFTVRGSKYRSYVRLDHIPMLRTGRCYFMTNNKITKIKGGIKLRACTVRLPVQS
jgi:hypothetical protein